MDRKNVLCQVCLSIHLTPSHFSFAYYLFLCLFFLYNLPFPFDLFSLFLPFPFFPLCFGISSSSPFSLSPSFLLLSPFPPHLSPHKIRPPGLEGKGLQAFPGTTEPGQARSKELGGSDTRCAIGANNQPEMRTVLRSGNKALTAGGAPHAGGRGSEASLLNQTWIKIWSLHILRPSNPFCCFEKVIHLPPSLLKAVFQHHL